MSVNKAILIGNVGRDPEIRYMAENKPIASFSLATTERAYTTAAGVNVPEKTQHRDVGQKRRICRQIHPQRR